MEDEFSYEEKVNEKVAVLSSIHLLTTAKRFLLAEIIRTSSTTLEDMVLFIKHHQIEPDWFNMRLPNGRTTNQCCEVADRLAIPTSSLKRKAAPSPPHQASKRRATSTSPVDQPGFPPMGYYAQSVKAPLLPRQAENMPVEPPSEQIPKKRGRPSRADKAKRDLRPNLPQTIAPRPIQPAQQPQTLPSERTPLPAMSPTPSVRTATPPAAYRTSRGSIDSQAEHPMTRTPSSDVTTDRARPVRCSPGIVPGTPPVVTHKLQRILTEGFSEDFTRDGRPVLPSPFRDVTRSHPVQHGLPSDRNPLSPKTLPSILHRPA